jgi:ribosomal-protein-alanine N-acetyltransferase
MNYFIETERLLIRELLPSDTEGMFAMDSDPEVHKYIGNHPLEKIEQSRDVIAFVRQQYADLGIGRWAVIEKGTNDFVGWTGFKKMTTPVNKHVGHYDFGYRLATRHWGKGYATESAKAVLHYGIEKLGFTDIYGMTDVGNAASRNVLEKLGFKLVEIFAYDAEPNWRADGELTTWYNYPDAGIPSAI